MPRTNLRDSIRLEYLAPDTRAKIIARNTFQFTDREGATVTRLHHTNVVRALPKGRYELNSGGWRTPTTKDRINLALRGYHVYAKDGSWYVCEGSWGYEGGIPFYDGMILPDAFKKVGAKKKGEAAEKREQKLRLQVRNFVKKLDKLECLPEPNGGDCWLCMAQRPELAGGSYKMDKDGPARNADALLDLAYARDGYDATRAGQDYWYTRNGHGVGFWDRTELDAEGLGDRLSDACRYSEKNLYRGDDGLIYLD